jgi:hypothetical protein
MKIVLLLAALSLLDCFAHAQQYNTLQAEGLKGKLKTIEHSVYRPGALPNELILDTTQINIRHFDQRGLITKWEVVSAAGKLQRYTLFDYHPNGLIKTAFSHNGAGKLTYREDYEIDENGRFTGGKAYNDKGLHRTMKITGPNKYGHWTRLNWYSLDDSIYREETFDYEDYRLVRHRWVEKGAVTMDMTTSYNDKGEPTANEGIHPMRPGQRTKSLTRIDAYDKVGNWTQRTNMDADGKTTIVIKRTHTYY